jgi:hypothetical protein
MMNPNVSLSEQSKPVVIFSSAVPSTSRSDIISLKGYNKCSILFTQVKTTGVTGSAITLTQSTDVANTGGKALPFTQAFRSLNTGTSGNTDALTAFAVSSNTFTTDTTSSVTDLYMVEVNETDLDITNGFDCVTLVMATAVNAIVSAVAILWPAKFGKTTPMSAIVD